MNEEYYTHEITKLIDEKRYAEALPLLTKALETHSNSLKLSLKKGWCLYNMYVDNPPKTEQQHTDFLETVTYIKDNYKPGDIESPRKQALFKMIEYLESNSEVCNKIEECYKELEQEDLSSTPIKTKSPNGRIITLPSDKEVWYTGYTKLLYNQGEYKKALTLCEQALHSVTFINQNKDWMVKRQADCLVKLNRVDEGIVILLQLSDTLPHWSVFAKLANAYLLQEDREKANKYFAIAARGVSYVKVTLYKQYAEFLKHSNPEMAFYHLKLKEMLYTHQGWNVPSELLNEIKANGSKNERINDQTLKLKLDNFWRTQIYADQDLLHGTITLLLSHGDSGFIKGDNGQDYYFQYKDIHCAKHSLQVGMPVSFYTKQGQLGLDSVEITLE
ncbi:MAG: hypothetical protein BEN18_09850 [Epulopiscium sp. Nuni2H_MBin001]|nr:MAG: hypothetical protein BEN18_09850 [Epulopiscium sp. Nuni2H_MBin001]